MQTYLVGGAVRDTILGIVPKDLDYVIVGATDNDVNQLIREGYSQVGASFPVFLHPTTGDEYALARVERKTGVGYQGFEFSTTDVSLEEDLSRRDLSINSMAMNQETGEIIDPFNGKVDLHNRVIRHTTAAFAEDPLRVFRAARFAARYNFDIATETMVLMRELVASGEIEHLAKERILKEVLAILMTDHPEVGFKALFTANALSKFSARLSRAYHSDAAFVATLSKIKFYDADYKLGFLIGMISTDDSISDKDFQEELHNMTCSIKTIKMACVIKNYGLMNDFLTCDEQIVIKRLKAFGFTDKSDLMMAFTALTLEFHIGNYAVYEHYFRIFALCEVYVEKIKQIPNAEIATKFAPNGRKIAEEIALAQIEQIKLVDRHNSINNNTLSNPFALQIHRGNMP